jgi:hypothetical protein
MVVASVGHSNGRFSLINNIILRDLTLGYLFGDP